MAKIRLSRVESSTFKNSSYAGPSVHKINILCYLSSTAESFDILQAQSIFFFFKSKNTLNPKLHVPLLLST